MLSQLVLSLYTLCQFVPFLGQRCLLNPPMLEDIGEVVRDVCILGGGSSGTYAAIRLHDMGKSVSLIEKKSRLGGHTNTYIDPSTKQPVSLGVHDYSDANISRNFFKRLGVNFKQIAVSDMQQIHRFNFQTGELVNSEHANVTLEMNTFARLAQEYPRLREGFEMEYPVSEDLVLPFREFAKKYKLENAMDVIFYSYSRGDFLDQPALYPLEAYQSQFDSKGIAYTIQAESGNNLDLYDRAYEILEPDVILSSQVEQLDRRDDYIKIVLKTPAGRKVIWAKQLLISFPPTLQNFKGFDLDEVERSIFGQFRSYSVYPHLARIPGVPKNLSDHNIISNYEPDTEYNLPRSPGLFSADATLLPDIFRVDYSGINELHEDEMMPDILAKIRQLQGPSSNEPSILDWADHAPFGLWVSGDAIRSGFYKDLYGLQGKRNTWYTGAAFQAYDAVPIWRYTDKIVQTMAG